jgi:hypothetical protein
MCGVCSAMRAPNGAPLAVLSEWLLAGVRPLQQQVRLRDPVWLRQILFHDQRSAAQAAQDRKLCECRAFLNRGDRI